MQIIDDGAPVLAVPTPAPPYQSRGKQAEKASSRERERYPKKADCRDRNLPKLPIILERMIGLWRCSGSSAAGKHSWKNTGIVDETTVSKDVKIGV
jgi:hypothetical protein